MRSARFSIRSLTAPALHAGEEGAGTVTDSATFGHVVPDLEPVRQKAVGIFQLGAKFGCGLEAVGEQGDDLFLHFLRPCLIMLPDGPAINALANRVLHVIIGPTDRMIAQSGLFPRFPTNWLQKNVQALV